VNRDQRLPFVSATLKTRIQIQHGPVVGLTATGLAFSLYAATVAPGLTWANFGADGGELLAAAVVNGVPHPPGYPLYILLLQAWLSMWGWVLPQSDLAWRGNLFSAFCAALSVGVTAHLVYRLTTGSSLQRVLQTGIAALAWTSAPLLWGQALITEVYGLYALLFTLVVWVLLVYHPSSARRFGLVLGFVIGLSLVSHLTTVLLIPALLYWLWQNPNRFGHRLDFWLYSGIGMLPGLLLYLRIPLVAGTPPPINWGYVTTAENFWWLISGAAYRHYLLGVDTSLLLGRLSHWASVITRQYTPVGFGIAIAGLYYLDQHHPQWRNFSLLWLLPISLYMLTYNTVDSEVYLLPVVWIMALWLPAGIKIVESWLTWPALRQWIGFVALGALLALTGIRIPIYSLQGQTEATDYLAELMVELEPKSVIFSSADAETFTLWYGAYATGDLLRSAPGSILVNVALYQFDWYRKLLIDLYPDLPGVGSSTVDEILTASADLRPVYFTENIAPASPDQLVTSGPLWRYHTNP
jgi:hypothetical protein